MLNQPEFHDLQKIQMFFDLMEKGAPAITFFDEAGRNTCRIGSENNHNAMEDCSVITATYSAGEQDDGSIAIIGPTRMDYEESLHCLI